MEVQKIRDQVVERAHIFQNRVKRSFDRKAKPDYFQQGDLVLKWDAQHEDKGKHGKFEHLWKDPYHITENRGNKSYVLQEVEGDFFPGGPVNGQFFKHYLTLWTFGVNNCRFKIILRPTRAHIFIETLHWERFSKCKLSHCQRHLRACR